MNLKSISGLAKNLGGVFQKNSPYILTGMAMAGTITAVALAIKATPKAMFLIEREQERLKVDELSKVDIIKTVFPCYIPTAAICVTTIACIVGVNAVHLRRNAALAGLYSLTEAAFREYQAKVVETIGQNKELKVRNAVDQDNVYYNSPTEIIFTGNGEVLCKDAISGRYFQSDIEKIKQSVNELNRELLSNMQLSLNDFYYALNIAGTSMGDELGFDIDKGLIEINYSSALTQDNKPCLVLNYKVYPLY